MAATLGQSGRMEISGQFDPPLLEWIEELDLTSLFSLSRALRTHFISQLSILLRHDETNLRHDLYVVIA